MLISALAVLSVIALANWPTTTSVGIDYRVATYQLPLYQKALAFLDRDIQMRGLVGTLVLETDAAETRALKLLDWTSQQVRPVPAGFPVVDDHPYHILVRGYGTFDQAADAYATLAAYAGIPATIEFSVGSRGDVLYAFALLKIDGGWRVFDVREGRVFRDRSGGFATLETLQAELTLTDSLRPPREARGAGYPELLRSLRPPEHLRPYDQMPLLRIEYEVRRLFGAR